MRRVSLIISFAAIIIVTSSCGRATANLEFDLDTNGNYEGFKTLPENYTPEQAIKDGCYVSKNGEEVGGSDAWKRFLENAKSGNNSSIRIMSIYDNAAYYDDLFYVEGYYRVFDSSSEDLTDRKYKYILDLRGRMPNAAEDNRWVVLTDDEALTFENVSLSMYSSSLDIINSISPFKIVSGMGF